MCRGKLEGLIVEGMATKEELELAWADIVAEYTEAMGSNEHKLYLNLFKEVTGLAADLKMIYLLIDVLKLVYSKRLADELNVLVEANFDFNPADMKEYERLLKSCMDRSTSKKIELEIKEDQLAEIQKKNTKPGKAPTPKYFNSILITLSDHAKYQVGDRIMVFEYCERISRFNQHIESLKKR